MRVDLTKFLGIIGKYRASLDVDASPRRLKKAVTHDFSNYATQKLVEQYMLF